VNIYCELLRTDVVSLIFHKEDFFYLIPCSMPSHDSSGKWSTCRTILFSCMFISILCMFRATSCSSSGESIVSIQLLVYVTLCRWPSGMQVGKFLPGLDTRLKDWNKHIREKNCASSLPFTRTIPSCTVRKT
jgi:hypothetical protein